MKKSLIAAAAIVTIASLSTGAVVSADASHHKNQTHAIAARADTRLNQAVRDGTITSAQKTAFQTELKTLRSERKTATSKTSSKADRQAERTKLKAELKSWASANNFPLAKLYPQLAS